jgi:hypothetical protein
MKKFLCAMALTLVAANIALANMAPPPRPPVAPTQPSTRPAAPEALQNSANWLMGGVAVSVMLVAGGLYLSRRR